MSKMVFQIKFTTKTPPSNLAGEKRDAYIAQRKFYDLTAEYNFFTYTLSKKKVVKNKDLLTYADRCCGVFDENNVYSKSEIDELKKKLATSDSAVWHGFISFDEETSNGFQTIDKAQKYLNQTFNNFIKDAGYNRDNLQLFAILHKDTAHRHIHFMFYEKEPKHIDKYGRVGYTKMCSVPKKAIANYLVNGNMYLREHKDEYYTARDEAMDKLKKLKPDLATNDEKIMFATNALHKLAKALPETGRVSYNSKNMKELRPMVDKVVKTILFAENGKAKKADDRVWRNMLAIQAELYSISQDNKLPYKDIEYFSKIKADYKARIGNVIIGLAKDFKDEKYDLRLRRTKYRDLYYPKGEKRKDGKDGKDKTMSDKYRKITAKRQRAYLGGAVRKAMQTLNIMAHNYYQQHDRANAHLHKIEQELAWEQEQAYEQTQYGTGVNS